MRGLLVLLPLVVAAPLAGAATPTLPQDADARFLGVDTCGSSQCHASPEPWRNATVMMNERLQWQARDRHARAWRDLVGERGQAIAGKLGIDEPGTAPACLQCHATFVPVAQRGPAFELEDGVGCESCHGAGGAFLRTHVQPTSSHAGNVAAGMYPNTEPAARARLCLSCHQGDASHVVNHRLYGAGHPRLRFELDTYSALQPYHFNPDADYRRRKPLPPHFALWANGQVVAARALLAQLDDATPHGLFPELARYDCHGCHRPLGRGGNGTPAMPRLLDAPLAMSVVVARVIAPALADPLGRGRVALAAAVGDPAQLATVRQRLDADLAALADAASASPPAGSQGASAVTALLADGRARAPLAFTHAESLAMALSTLVTAEFEAGRLAPPAYARATSGLDRVYAALADEATYQPDRLAAALDELAAALPSLTSESP